MPAIIADDAFELDVLGTPLLENLPFAGFFLHGFTEPVSPIGWIWTIGAAALPVGAILSAAFPIGDAVQGSAASAIVTIASASAPLPLGTALLATYPIGNITQEAIASTTITIENVPIGSLELEG